MNTRNVELRVQVEDVHAFNLRVFEEDCLRVETKKPERLPLDSISRCAAHAFNRAIG
jgi:hypothetical protein